MFYNFASACVILLDHILVSVGQQWFFNHTALADAVGRFGGLPQEEERQEMTRD